MQKLKCHPEFHLSQRFSDPATGRQSFPATFALPLYDLAARTTNGGIYDFTPSIEEITAYFATSRRNIENALRYLRASGWIHSVERGGPYAVVRHQDWILQHPGRCSPVTRVVEMPLRMAAGTTETGLPGFLESSFESVSVRNGTQTGAGRNGGLHLVSLDVLQFSSDSSAS